MSELQFLSPAFAKDMLATMQDNNAWFISELVDLERKALDASLELEQHRQSMSDRETIMAKLKEIIEC